MPMIIDGEKYSLRDLEGTDLKCVHDFMNKSKSKAAIMIYVDEDGKVQTAGCWKSAKARNVLQDKVLIEIL